MSDWYDAEQHLERAGELFARRKWDLAIDALKAALASNPLNPAIHFNLGLAYEQKGQDALAAKCYAQALDLEPENLQTLLRLGKCLTRIGQYEQALSVLEKTQSIDPSFEPGYCARIVPCVKLGQHELAEELFYQARLYKDHCPDCYASIAVGLYERGLYDKAIYCWNKALEQDQTHPRAHLNIARAYWQKGDRENARLEYQKQWRIDPRDVVSLIELGQLLTGMGLLDEAGEKLHLAMDLTPRDPRVLMEYARWLIVRELPSKAQDILSRLKRESGILPGHCALEGRIAFLNGDRAMARRLFKEELRAKSNQPRVIMDLGNILADCGFARLAIIAFERYVSLFPRDAAGWQNLGAACLSINRHQRGILACEKALELDPRRLGAMHNLAVAFERGGDYDRAIAWIVLARDIDPADASLQRLEYRVKFRKMTAPWVNALKAIMKMAFKRSGGDNLLR